MLLLIGIVKATELASCPRTYDAAAISTATDAA